MTVPETIPENYKLTFNAKIPKKSNDGDEKFTTLLDFGNVSIVAWRNLNWVRMFVIYRILNSTTATKVPRWL